MSIVDRSTLYRFDRVAPTIPSLARVDESVREQFRTQGYFAVERFLSPERLAEAKGAFGQLLRQRLGGEVGIQMEPHWRENLTGNPDEDIDRVRKLMDYVDAHPVLRAIADDPDLHAVLESLMGDKAVLFQDMGLIKPPRGGSEKPWHQDCAYFDIPVTETVVGVWIALDDATAANGCMHIVPGSHRDGPVPHFIKRDWQICDADARTDGDVMAVLPGGGALLFHGLLHHGTPENHSDQRRWALQLHYRPARSGKLTDDEKKALFGGDARGLTC